MQKLLLGNYYLGNRATSQICEVLPNMVLPRFGGKYGGALSIHMQVILDSRFARPGSAPAIRDGKKREFRDWTSSVVVITSTLHTVGRRQFETGTFFPMTL